MGTIASLVVSVSANTVKFIKDMKGAQKSVGGFRESTISASRGLNLLKGAIAGITVGAVLRTLVAEFNATREAMDSTMKSARLLGVTFAELKGFKLAADLTGLGAEKIAPALATLQKRLGEAARGQGAAVPALKELGLNAEDLIQLRLPEALNEIADRFSQVDNTSREAAIAANLFSKANIHMALVLRDGADALKAMRKEQEKFGLSDEQVATVEWYNDAMTRIGYNEEGVKERMTAAWTAAVRWSAALWVGKDAIDANVAALQTQKESLADVTNQLQEQKDAEEALAKLQERRLQAQDAARGSILDFAQSLKDQMALLQGVDRLDLQLRDVLAEAKPVMPGEAFDRYRDWLVDLVDRLKDAKRAQQEFNAQQAAAKRQEMERDAIRARGKALEESLFTPGERFLGEIADIERLMKVNAISTGVGFLAQQRAASRYLDREPTLIGSATRGSAAAYEATMRAQHRGDSTQNKIRVAIEEATQEASKQSQLLASIDEKTQPAKIAKALP